MKKKLITLIRHAESINNALYDSSDTSYYDLRKSDPELTDLGIQQSKLLQKYFDSNKTQYNYDLIISSPMLRALQTTQLSFSNFKSPKIVWTNTFESKGPYQQLTSVSGMKRSEFLEMFPEFSIPICLYKSDRRLVYKKTSIYLIKIIIPNEVSENGWYIDKEIETSQQTFNRARRLIANILAIQNCENIVIVSHQKFIAIMMTVIIKEFGLFYNPPIWCKFSISNTGITNIMYSKNKFIIKDFNIIPHLEA